MKRFLLAIGVMVTVAGFVASAAQTRSQAETLLADARHIEVVTGDLAAAVKAYQAIVVRFQVTDRAVAAQALWGLGDCYRKLGDARLTGILERIVRDYADQTSVAASARTALGASGALRPAVAGGLVCAGCVGPFDRPFTISPDRRWVGYTEANSDLMIRNLKTGDVRALVTFPRESYASNRFRARHALWSPDMKQIAYFFRDTQSPGPVRDRSQLRVLVNAPGGATRTLTDNPDFIYVLPHAWWPDGKSILVSTQRRDLTWQLGRVSVATGVLTVLRSLNWQFNEFHNGPDLSPDGKFIVYSTFAVHRAAPPPFESRAVGGRSIHVLAVDGTSDVILPAAASGFTSPVWTSDGSRILYTSDRNGSDSYDLWAIGIRDGKAAGVPMLAKASIGGVALVGNMKSDLLYYVQQQSESRRISVVDLDVRTTTINMAGREATWSADGKSLAWFQGDTRSPLSPLVVHSVETGRQKVYPLDRGNRSGPYWTSTGSAILLSVNDEATPNRGFAIDRVDLTTSAVQRLATYAPPANQRWDRDVVLAPDDRTIYVRVTTSTRGVQQSQVLAVDLETGRSRPVLAGWAGMTRALETFRYTIGNAFEIVPVVQDVLGIAPSIDGKSAVVTVMKNGHTDLVSMDLDSGQYRSLYGPVPGRRIGNQVVSRLSDPKWLEGNRGIAFGIQQDDLTWRFVRIAPDGRVEPFSATSSGEFTLEKGTLRFDISPDGRHVAAERVLTVKSELSTLDLMSLFAKAR